MPPRNAAPVTKTPAPPPESAAATTGTEGDDDKYLTKAEAPGLIRGVLEDFFGPEGEGEGGAADPPAAEPRTYKDIEAAAEKLVETAVAKLTPKAAPAADPKAAAAAATETTPQIGGKPKRFLERVFGWSEE